MTNQLRKSKKNTKMTTRKSSQKKGLKTQNQTQTQKGCGLFTTHIKTYRNLKYKDSKFILPILICPAKGCNGKEFKHKYLKISTRGKSFIESNLFSNKHNSFTCMKCGFIQMYSANITYDSDKV